MKILALDAALGYFSAALAIDERVVAERSASNDALETGIARIARLLDSAGLRLAALDCIAVGTGPGSFTGVRIVLSFAKSLAYGANVPLVGISSYDVLAPPDTPLPVLAAVAGRPGVICARLTVAGGAQQTACGVTSTVCEELIARVPPAQTLTVAANTEDVLSFIAERRQNVRRLITRAAENPAIVIAQLARFRQPVNLHAIKPDYGELPAVTVPKARTIRPLSGA